MAQTEPQTCARCKRPTPPIDSFEFVEWEAIGDGTKMICPGCLTLLEEQDIEADMEQLAEAASQLHEENHSPRGGAGEET